MNLDYISYVTKKQSLEPGSELVALIQVGWNYLFKKLDTCNTFHLFLNCYIELKYVIW